MDEGGAVPLFVLMDALKLDGRDAQPAECNKG
jgi:hypothetical protein